MPTLQKRSHVPVESGPTDTPAGPEADGRAPVQGAPLSELSEDVLLGPDAPAERGSDRPRTGAGDPAMEFFRRDATRRGYRGDEGFTEYLKKYGIVSSRERARQEKNEVDWDFELGLPDNMLTGVWGSNEKRRSVGHDAKHEYDNETLGAKR